jgi:MerR family mercuric resistance operon transcriptional regulator
MQPYTIGQLAKAANVNLETIRYYERRGLIPEPPRNLSGHRQYSDDAVLRTKFIKRSQQLGFSLKEISEILSLRMEPGITCGDIKAKVEAKMVDVAKGLLAGAQYWKPSIKDNLKEMKNEFEAKNRGVQCRLSCM